MIRDQQQVREAFLAHRLSRAELVKVVEGAPLADFLDPAVDLRDAVSPERFTRAVASLGLDREMASLRPDQVWTPYQRALYRRLSTPEHDPALPAAPGEPAGSPDLAAAVRNGFETWDRDHDLRLSVEEVDRALAEATLAPAAAAALAVLRTFPQALGSCQPHDGEGVTQQDMILFARGGIPGAPSLTARLNADFLTLSERASAMPEPGPLTGDPFSLRQGRLGSCVLLATMAGMDDLSGLVVKAEPGSFAVRFPDGEEETVYDLAPGERLVHAVGDGEARWPGLVEMALGQRLARSAGARSARLAVDGVPPEEALRAFTGREAVKVSLDERSLDDTRAWLREIFSRPGPRVCGTRPDPILKGQQFDVEELHNGIQNAHAYTLLGYDPGSDTVLLRNPWRKNPWAGDPDSADGVFRMPVPQFYASFRWIASPG